MSTGERFKEGVRVRRITRGGELYRVELVNRDYFFITPVEKWEVDSLRRDQSVRVSDFGRVFILWKEKGKLVAYERATN